MPPFVVVSPIHRPADRLPKMLMIVAVCCIPSAYRYQCCHCVLSWCSNLHDYDRIITNSHQCNSRSVNAMAVLSSLNIVWHLLHSSAIMRFLLSIPVHFIHLPISSSLSLASHSRLFPTLQFPHPSLCLFVLPTLLAITLLCSLTSALYASTRCIPSTFPDFSPASPPCSFLFLHWCRPSICFWSCS